MSENVVGKSYINADGSSMSQGFIILSLFDKTENKEFVLATTHLKAKNGMESQETRSLQVPHAASRAQRDTTDLHVGFSTAGGVKQVSVVFEERRSRPSARHRLRRLQRRASFSELSSDAKKQHLSIPEHLGFQGRDGRGDGADHNLQVEAQWLGQEDY